MKITIDTKMRIRPFRR